MRPVKSHTLINQTGHLFRLKAICILSEGLRGNALRRSDTLTRIILPLTENDGPADLYVTFSGSHENVGIYKFGENRVSPLNMYKGAATP